jgi:hypothetical protein
MGFLGMKGWLTVTTGAASIAYGLGGAVIGLHDQQDAVNYALAGLAALGIGRKLDRIDDDVKIEKDKPTVRRVS